MPSKITDLTALGAAPDDADLLEIVDDVAGTPVSKKITVANLLSSLDLSNVLQVVGSAEPSAASNVDFALPAGYAGFELRGWLRTSVDSNVELLCDIGAGFDVGSNYMWFRRRHRSGFSSSDGSDPDTKIDLLSTIGGSATGAMFNYQISRALDADSTLFIGNVYTDITTIGEHALEEIARYFPTDVVQAIRIQPASGTITGNVRLIGIP